MVKIYKIEKGIKLTEPVQAKSDGEASKVALTMREMVVGDSFLIRDELEAMKAGKVVRDANGRAKKRSDGRLFATRKVKNGTRIWRVK